MTSRFKPICINFLGLFFVLFVDCAERAAPLRPDGQLRRGEGMGRPAEQDLPEQQGPAGTLPPVRLHQRHVDLVSSV